MSKIIRQFGEHLVDVVYSDRPSAYAVIYRDTFEIAVVRTPRGFFLPGGGLELDETPVQAVLRESLEECGLHIQVMEHLGSADQLVFTDHHATGWRIRMLGRHFAFVAFSEKAELWTA